MNFIERNYMKVALVLGIATAFSAITTVYAASNSNGWQNGVYLENGQAKTEWLFTEEGPVYYLDTQGRASIGWKTIDGDTYYFNANGERVNGQVVIDAHQYTFQKNGQLLIGWQDNNTTYYNQYGVKLTGEQEIDGKNYYFDESGTLTTGWVDVNGNKRYYLNDGSFYKGLQKIGKKSYYFDKNGYMKTGFVTIKKKKYYFKENGEMAVGKVTIDKKKYQFNSNGVLLTGWQKKNGKIMYYNKYGFPKKGWQTIKGKKYYFDERGYAYTDTTYEGYEFNKNGEATKLPEERTYSRNNNNSHRRPSGNSNHGSSVSLNPVGNGNNATAASIACNYIGYNYVWGGASPAGFDCSGLVYYAYRCAGINVPRSGYSQAYMGSAVSYDNIQVGDVIIWDGGAHVSIYIGNGMMVHATNPRRGVTTNSVSEWASYGQSITGIRRP